ncbi:MAG: hypothetical protein LBU51_01685, partial [Bacteroidales bacterium]|nr:hypothetical protein [Bacteroidales bacterium]
MKELNNKYSPAHRKQHKSTSERIKAFSLLLLATAFFTLFASTNMMAQYYCQPGTGWTYNPSPP